MNVERLIEALDDQWWYVELQERDDVQVSETVKPVYIGMTSLYLVDGWKHIEYFTDSFAVDPKNPRVEVVIEDYEGGKQNGSKNKN